MTDYISESLIETFFKEQPILKQGAVMEQPKKEMQLANVAKDANSVDWDVVAIYDNAGIPSIMHRFRKTSNKELFGGSDKAHPAFIIGGVEYDEIYISVYLNCEINGKPYSLPYQKPWTNITNDGAAKACFSKGDGWHLLTAPEWGLLADTSLKNGTLPHGNTANGEYYEEPEEHGQEYVENSSRTLTGSGPATWTHDHTPTGVHDLCGNVWEMLRGLRIKDGRLQAAKNNDAALDIDLTTEGDGWQAVLDNAGKAIRVSINDDGDITITSEQENEDTGHNYYGRNWEDVKTNCESEQLKELALFPGEPKARCFMGNTDVEYFPLRGGHWLCGANAGVFCARINSSRTKFSSGIGFRSAYFKKN